MSTIILFDNTDINDQFISPPRIRDLQGRQLQLNGASNVTKFPQISWLQMRVLIIIHFHFHRLKISRFPFVWDILEVFAVIYLRFSESVFFALNLHFAIFARVLKEVSRKFWHRNKRMSPKILVMKIGLLGIIKVRQLFGWNEKEPVQTSPLPPDFFLREGRRLYTGYEKAT